MNAQERIGGLGAHDDFRFSNIFPATQKLAKKMVAEGVEDEADDGPR